MYEATISRTIGDHDECEGFTAEGSIAVRDKVEQWIGQMIMTWPGEWEITAEPWGDPEMSATLITGKSGHAAFEIFER